MTHAARNAYSNLQWDQQRIALDSQTNFPPRNSYRWRLTSLSLARCLKGASLRIRETCPLGDRMVLRRNGIFH